MAAEGGRVTFLKGVATGKLPMLGDWPYSQAYTGRINWPYWILFYQKKRRRRGRKNKERNRKQRKNMNLVVRNGW